MRARESPWSSFFVENRQFLEVTSTPMPYQVRGCGFAQKCPWSTVSVPRVKGPLAWCHPCHGEVTWAKHPSMWLLELRFCPQNPVSALSSTACKMPFSNRLTSGVTVESGTDPGMRCLLRLGPACRRGWMFGPSPPFEHSHLFEPKILKCLHPAEPGPRGHGLVG